MKLFKQSNLAEQVKAASTINLKSNLLDIEIQQFWQSLTASNLDK